MKSFYTLYNTDFPNMTEVTSTANKTFGKGLINATQTIVLAYAPFRFLEYTDTVDSVDGTNNYQLPAHMMKVTNVTVTVGTVVYRPKPTEDPDFWNYLQSLGTDESDVAQYFYQYNGKLYIWPTCASDGNTITFRGRKRTRELSLDDYTTGTLLTATAGDETIAGNGTTWVTGTTENHLRIDLPAGDYKWYEIDSITSTTALELVKPYEGASIATGTGTYTIGEMSIIPGEYHDLLLWRPLALYFMQNAQNQSRADRFWMMYDGGFERGLSPNVGGLMKIMMDQELEQTEGAFLEPTESVVEDIEKYEIDSITGEGW